MSLIRNLFNSLPFNLRHQIFRLSANSLGVESYGVAGHAGVFAGPINDLTITGSYLRGKVWPECEIETLKTFFDGHGTLFDIGANLGLVTIALAQTGVNVVAFEPDPDNCSMLRGNIARNGQSERVTVLQNAIYREATTLRFSKNAYNSGDHHLSSAGEIEVKAIPLDSLTRPSGRFGIKIDTQGAEPGVFEGGQKTILAADMVLSEFWPYGLKRMGNKPDAVLEMVKQFPYGRFIDKRASDWMSGPLLADKLFASLADLHEWNDMDFVIAKERF
jgi:FkbM family methyltransferase